MRSFARVAWLCGATWCAAPSPAAAQLLLAVSADAPSPISHAELAYAFGTSEPVSWISLRVDQSPIAIVAALPEGTRAEPALDAWFESLETVGSPRVLPPNDGSCSGSDALAAVRWPRSESSAPNELRLERAEDVNVALEELGLALSGALPKAERYLVWSWPTGDGERTTRTLRVSGGEVVMPLAPLPGVPISLNMVTAGPARFADERDAAELGVTFRGDAQPTSDYLERLTAWFERRREPLLELRSRTVLWDWSGASAATRIPPLMVAYASAAARERSGIDAEECATQLSSHRSAGASAASACGPARDAELALSAAGEGRATLERFEVVAAEVALPGALEPGGDVRLANVRATSAAGASCGGGIAPTLTEPPTVTTPNTSDSETIVVEQTTVTAPSAEVSCGSSTQSGSGDSESCSSDSSGSEQSSDSCSGDTSSSSSDSSDSGCGSDTSSSSDSSDSGCGSDTSSSSDSSDGCDGGSDKSGYDGDTCTGRAAPGAERTEKPRSSLTGSGARPRRLKTSLWTLAFAAVVLPIRRRKRAPRTSG